jgi:hypothetical protein
MEKKLKLSGTSESLEATVEELSCEESAHIIGGASLPAGNNYLTAVGVVAGGGMAGAYTKIFTNFTAGGFEG